MPAEWKAALLAVDGDVAIDVMIQIQTLPADATHIVVSAGGNDAIGCIPLLSDPVPSVEKALSRLADIRANFRRDYKIMLNSVLSKTLPTAVCTIYDAVPGLSREQQTALALFNEVILREASINGLPVIDLRVICDEEIDYSEVSPIEPSHNGGKKIARAILDTLTTF